MPRSFYERNDLSYSGDYLEDVYDTPHICQRCVPSHYISPGEKMYIINFKLLNDIFNSDIYLDFGYSFKNDIILEALKAIDILSFKLPYLFCNKLVEECVVRVYPQYVIRGTTEANKRIISVIENNKEISNNIASSQNRYLNAWLNSIGSYGSRELANKCSGVRNITFTDSKIDLLIGLIWLRARIFISDDKYLMFSEYFLTNICLLLQTLSDFGVFLVYLFQFDLKELKHADEICHKQAAWCVENNFHSVFTSNIGNFKKYNSYFVNSIDDMLELFIIKKRNLRIGWFIDKVSGPFLQIKRLGGKLCREDARDLNYCFPFTSELDQNHMLTTLGHLIVKSSQMLDKSLFNNFRLLLLNLPVGLVTNQLTIGLGLIGHDNMCVKDLINHALDSHVFLGSYPDQMAWFKNISTLARTFSVDFRGDDILPREVGLLAYIDLGFGRSTMLSDIGAEFKNRTTATYHLISDPEKWDNVAWRDEPVAYLFEDEDFYRRLNDKLSLCIPKLIDERHAIVPYNDFLNRRADWVTAGSANGPESTLEVEGKLVKLTKREYNEVINKDYFLISLHTDGMPMEIASHSNKFENSKPRAIYGTSTLHYMHSTYATFGMEERLHLLEGCEKGSSGVKEVAYVAKRLKISEDAQMHLMMLDYADFNVQHTPRAQAALFEMNSLYGQEKGFHSDWIKANNYIAKAKYNMKVKISKNAPTGGEPNTWEENWDIKQGMFSGTRCTDLINTLLNKCYYEVAKDILRERVGLTTREEYRVHQGDDVWVSASNPAACAAIYNVLNHMGLIMNPIKQMAGAARGEYLRILFILGVAYGYCWRSLYNGVLKEVQRPLVEKCDDMLLSIQDTCETLCRRGMSIAAVRLLHEECVSYWSAIKYGENDHVKFTLPRCYIESPKCVGGLGVLPPGYIWEHSHHNPPIIPKVPELEESVSDAKFANLPCEMSKDWISYVSNKLPSGYKEIDAESVKKALLRRSYINVAKQALGHRAMKNWKERMLKWRDDIPEISKQYRLVEVINDKGIPIYNQIDYLVDKTRHEVRDNICINMKNSATTSKIIDDYVEITKRNILSVLYSNRLAPMIANNTKSHRPFIKRNIKALTLMERGWRTLTPESAEYVQSNSMIHKILRMIRNTPFKSVELAAAAYHSSDSAAIRSLANISQAMSMGDSEAVSALSYVAFSGSYDLLDALSSGSIIIGKELCYFAHPNLLNSITNLAMSNMINMAEHYKSLSSIPVLQSAGSLYFWYHVTNSNFCNPLVDLSARLLY